MITLTPKLFSKDYGLCEKMLKGHAKKEKEE
jgi:hypothetical protein